MRTEDLRVTVLRPVDLIGINQKPLNEEEILQATQSVPRTNVNAPVPPYLLPDWVRYHRSVDTRPRLGLDLTTVVQGYVEWIILISQTPAKVADDLVCGVYCRRGLDPRLWAVLPLSLHFLLGHNSGRQYLPLREQWCDPQMNWSWGWPTREVNAFPKELGRDDCVWFDQIIVFPLTFWIFTAVIPRWTCRKTVNKVCNLGVGRNCPEL